MKDRDSLRPLTAPPVGGVRPSKAQRQVRKGLVSMNLARAKALGSPVAPSKTWRRLVG